MQNTYYVSKGIARVMKHYTLSDIAKMTGAKPRSVQLWADAGIIKAEPSTERAGSGTHRRFSRQEAMVACIVAPFAEQKIAIGGLSDIGRAVRGAEWLKGRTEGKVAFLDDAAKGIRQVYLIVKWGVVKGGKIVVIGTHLVSDQTPDLNFFQAIPTQEEVWIGGRWINVAIKKTDVISINECLKNLGAD